MIQYSVVIPSYNRAKTITNSIQSVLNQKIKDLEVIIVDDGSTDNTKEVIESIKDDRIHYFYITNHGACYARNYGISQAKGKYIAFHDSDDEWHLDKLEIIDNLFNSFNPDVICSGININDGNSIREYGPNLETGWVTTNSPFGTGTQTIVGKKEVFENIKFDEKQPRLQDYDIMIRICQQYKVYYYKTPLVEQYIQNDSITKSSPKLILAAELLEQKYLKENLTYIHQDLSNIYSEIAKNECLAKKEYKSYLKKSYQLHKSFKGFCKILLSKIGLYSKFLK